ncbi:Aldehyde/histidinol dehydrogenase [Mycena crocata]|nr:Aldehyde/histidinol dehydrogenase [Mycena crocata]
MCEETGATLPFADLNVASAAEMIRDVAGRCSAVMGSIPICQDEDTSALVLKEPYGVVLAFAPWYKGTHLFIVDTGTRSVMYAIAAGNTCVMKGSELSPRSLYHVGRIFTDAGLPAGVLNIIYTSRQESPAITTHLINAPAVKRLNFTGSSAVGAIIAAARAETLPHGARRKSRPIVPDDADVELAAMQCALGAFLHSGQICMSTERILMHRAVLEKFRRARSSLRSDAQQGARSGGVGERRDTANGEPRGSGTAPKNGRAVRHASAPIVVEGVTPNMALYRDESFGPSVSVIAVDCEDEAVAIANDSDYGLNGAVFTQDLARGLRVAKRLECGAVHINSMSVHDEAAVPHGGVKGSGWERFNPQWGIEEFLRLKTITYKEWGRESKL